MFPPTSITYEKSLARSGSFHFELGSHLIPLLPSLWAFLCGWCRYDAEESGTVVDGEDAADVFVGDDKLFAAREAALAKRSGGSAQARLTRADGSKMSLAASKKFSALHADNQQWEDRQLMASGVVRRTEQDLDIDDEEENKAILLVHGTCTAPHALLGRREPPHGSAMLQTAA